MPRDVIEPVCINNHRDLAAFYQPMHQADCFRFGPDSRAHGKTLFPGQLFHDFIICGFTEKPFSIFRQRKRHGLEYERFRNNI